MIKRKDLIFMRHGKEGVLIGFSYVVEDKNVPLDSPDRVCFTAEWNKVSNEGEWNMRVVLPRDRDSDSQVYNFGYKLPRDRMPVELIAAAGLKYFQLYLKKEIQLKSNFDFALGELLKDM